MPFCSKNIKDMFDDFDATAAARADGAHVQGGPEKILLETIRFFCCQ